MGLWDRFGRGSDAPSAGTPGVSTDEQAIARYRYMLRTAPPEAIEDEGAFWFEEEGRQVRLALETVAE